MLYENAARYAVEIIDGEPGDMPPQDGLYKVIDVSTGMVVAIVSKARFFREYAEASAPSTTA